MERDMSSQLATKSDLALLRQETKSEFALLPEAIKGEFVQVRQGMAAGFALAAQRLDHEIAKLNLTLTVWLGSMMVVVAGLLFAALKLT